MDAIASCAFGVDAGSFSDPNSQFVSHARKVFRRDFFDAMKVLLGLMPGGMQIAGLLNISIMKPKETAFFYDVLESTLKQRMNGQVQRNDLINLMIKAMENEGDENEVTKDEETSISGKSTKKLDHLSLIATPMALLIAGYDTTAQTMSFCFYELAKNPEIQERLQAEIDQAYEDCDGAYPDYTTIQSLEYLDMVIHETLRLHPIVPIITRACTKDFELPGTNLTIKKDEEVLFSTVAIHSNPKYYPNPTQFNPEHFSKEAKAERHP